MKGVRLGANLQLQKGREDIGYTTIENSTTYRFFTSYGLGKGATPRNGWSFTRNYYSKGIGGQVQVEYQVGGFTIFHAAGFLTNTEECEDGSANPEKGAAGDYLSKTFRFLTIVNFENSLSHSLRFILPFTLGEGIEFIQEPYLIDNITYYRTLAEASKYSTTRLQPKLTGLMAKSYNSFLNKWEIEGGVEMNILTNEYVLEARESYSNIIPTLRFDYSVFVNLFKSYLEVGLNSFIISMRNLHKYDRIPDR